MIDSLLALLFVWKSYWLFDQIIYILMGWIDTVFFKIWKNNYEKC